MITAEIAAAALIAANIVIWVPLLLRWLRVPSVRLLHHPGRHVATERVHAGGRYLGTQPRCYALPLTEQEIDRAQTDDDPPWDITTAAQPVLTDAYTLAMYQQGEYGVKPQREAAEAERLAEAFLP